MRAGGAVSFALALLLLASAVFADGASSGSPSPSPSPSPGPGGDMGGGGWFDIESLVGPIVRAVNRVPEGVANKTANKIQERAVDIAESDFRDSGNVVAGMAFDRLRKPPKVEKLYSPWARLVAVLCVLLVVQMYAVGMRYMVSGASPERRERAKESLKSALALFVLLPGSYFLYSSLLELAYAVSNYMYPAKVVVQAWSWSSYPQLAMKIGIGVIYFIVSGLTWLTIMLVNLMSSLGVVIFPIAIALYLSGWIPTKQLGASILMFLVTLLLVPILDMTILATSYTFGLGTAIAGLALVALVNYQVLKRVFGFVVAPAAVAVGSVRTVIAGIPVWHRSDDGLPKSQMRLTKYPMVREA